MKNNKMIASNIKSKKYVRNPRAKGWMLCRRMKNGTIECLSDESTMSVNWSKYCGILWLESKSPASYLKTTQEWKTFNGEDTFVIRVNTKNCPIVIDFENESSRARKGNVLFSAKQGI